MTGDDSRRVARALLAAHDPIDERERASIARVLNELERLDAPFDEHADATHATGSAVVIGPRGVLLHRHRKLGIWMQPGGHLEPGEQPWDAAVRETFEETGLPVAHPPDGPCLVHVDVHGGTAALPHVHLDLRFLVLVSTDDEPRPPPGESQQVRWCTWEDAHASTDESLRGALVVARRLTPDA